MQRQLVIIDGPDQGRTFSLEDGQTLVVGRSMTSDTKINDPGMSRVHCRVQVDAGTTLLIDAGSSSGTLVDGSKVTQHPLQPGDVFQVGNTQIRYQLDSPPDATTVVGEQMFGRPKPPPKVAPLKDLVGQTLDRYRVDQIISQGQSGMIFKGHDTEKERVCAVKVLTPDPVHSDEQRDRFVRAMKTMLNIRHNHIVRLYAAGKKGPYCWCAMQYVDGESLAHVIDRIGIEGMLDWREVWRVAGHVGCALAEAYKHKIVHRNVTPTNILRRTDDKVCLLGDLMLAKAMEGTLAKQITQPGQLIGDVPYMSPERTRDSSAADARSDIYGLGATCYALLTGRTPFEADSLPELIAKVRSVQPVKPKEYQLAINDLFQDAVLKMIAKRPEDRYQTPTDLLDDLERIGRYDGLKADW